MSLRRPGPARHAAAVRRRPAAAVGARCRRPRGRGGDPGAGADRGRRALIRCTAELDRVDVSDGLRVPQSAIAQARATVDPDLAEALEVAFGRILAYHAHEGAPPGDLVDGGITVGHLTRAVERAGIYAPGGRARYPSTVLMCAAPARVAGVGSIALCVPPARTATIDDATLCAAAIAGVDEVYRIGGAQAIAAMAYGTESVPAVDVIAGPGNALRGRGQAPGVGRRGRRLGLRRAVRDRRGGRSRRATGVRRHRPGRAGRARARRAGLVGHAGTLPSPRRSRPRSTGSWPPRPGGPTSRRRWPRPGSPASSTGPRRRWPCRTRSPPSTSS